MISISRNGWGTNNIAVVMLHWLKDGSPFVAVYGHIQSEVEPGQRIKAGDVLGIVGEWDSGDHLHQTIYPGTDAKAPLGLIGCPADPDTDLDANGTTDPIAWITQKEPEDFPQTKEWGRY